MTNSSSTTTLFNGYIASVLNVTALRAFDVSNLCTGAAIVVGGNVALGDGDGGIYTLDTASTSNDDDKIVIAPASGSGRWLLSAGAGNDAATVLFKAGVISAPTAQAFETYVNQKGADAAALASTYAVASQSSATASQTSANASQASASLSSSYAGNSSIFAAQAAVSAGQVVSALAASTAYPNSATTTVPTGVTGYTSLVAGTGGTAGTYALAFSGGGGTGATGTFTVAAGAVSAITITGPGYGYTSAPTVSFAAATGLTGASATITIGALVASGKFYWATSTDGQTLTLYQNASGTATAASPATTIPTKAALDTTFAGFYAPVSQTLGSPNDPINGTNGASGGYTFIFTDPVKYGVPVVSFKIYARTTGTIKLKRLTKSGNTYTETGNVSFNITTTGLQTLTPSLTYAAGEYVGFYQSTQMMSIEPTGTAPGTAVAFMSGDLTSYANPIASDPNVYGCQIVVGGSVQVVTSAAFLALQTSVAGVPDAIAALKADYTQGFGVSGTIPTPTSTATVGTFMFADPVSATVPITSVTLTSRNSGTVKLKSYTLTNGTYVESGSVTLSIAASGTTYTLTPAFTVNAGDYLGFYHSGPVGFVTGGGGSYYGNGIKFVGTGEQSSFSTFTGSFGNGDNPFCITVIASGHVQTVTATALAAIQNAASTFTSKYITPTNTLYAYGDSMTQGNGGTPYPTQLTTLLGNRTAINRGVGAQRAPDIFGRFGSYPITVPALTIPASGTVDFTVPANVYDRSNPITTVNPSATFTGKLSGVPGTLSMVSYSSPNYTYRFSRTTAGSAVSVIPNTCFFIDDTEGRKFSTALLWVGRNSVGLQDTSGASSDTQYDSVMKWHERAIGYLKSVDRHFIVMGPANRNDEYAGSTATVAGAALNGDQAYSLIIRIENEMRARWPDHFVNQRGHVVAGYNAGDPTDTADFAADRTPTSLRADLLHYNTAGYAIVAQQAYNRIQFLGY
jgi:hypothetical protein